MTQQRNAVSHRCATFCYVGTNVSDDVCYNRHDYCFGPNGMDDIKKIIIFVL
jgi:hypothetical protein